MTDNLGEKPLLVQESASAVEHVKRDSTTADADGNPITTAIQKGCGSAVAAEVKNLNRRVSFSEAVKSLHGRLDLEAALKKADLDHFLWGLVPRLIEYGFIKSADEYAQLFKKATIDKQDLAKVKRLIKQGTSMDVIFDSGKLLPDELCKILFIEAGFAVGNSGSETDNKEILEKLKKLRKITPLNNKSINDLYHVEELQEISQLFIDAYHAGEPIRQTEPRILFVPKGYAKHHGSGLGALYGASKEGDKLMDVSTGFLFFRNELDHEFAKVAGENTPQRTVEGYWHELSTYLHSLHQQSIRKRSPPDWVNDLQTGFALFVDESGLYPVLDFCATSRNNDGCNVDVRYFNHRQQLPINHRIVLG